MVRAFGLMLIILGLGLLVVPVIGAVWAWWMYSIGLSITAYAGLIAWLGISFGMIAGGTVLMRQNSRVVSEKKNR